MELIGSECWFLARRPSYENQASTVPSLNPDSVVPAKGLVRAHGRLSITRRRHDILFWEYPYSIEGSWLVNDNLQSRMPASYR